MSRTNLKGFLSVDDIRQCQNPKCGRLFLPRDKYHPGQLYCGAKDCNRTRHNQRQWEYSHRELQRHYSSKENSFVPGAVINCRLFWLVTGLLAMVHGLKTTEELTETITVLITTGCRLCGRDRGLALLQKILMTVAYRE